MSAITDAAIMNISDRIGYVANFEYNIDAEVELLNLDVRYSLGHNFNAIADITIEIDAKSTAVDGYMSYLLEMEVDLSEESEIKIFGREFSKASSIENAGDEILDESFVAEFFGTIQFTKT